MSKKPKCPNCKRVLSADPADPGVILVRCRCGWCKSPIGQFIVPEDQSAVSVLGRIRPFSEPGK